MSALERVARRIGMEHSNKLKGCQTDRGWVSVDRAGPKPTYHYCCGDDELRAYLLTGDRPLRVQVEYDMDTGPDDDGWVASAYTTKNGWRKVSFTSEELPAAIIALAERIEGEGRE